MFAADRRGANRLSEGISAARHDARDVASSSEIELDRLSRTELEGVCMHNLLGARQARVFFKDLEGRFLLVSEGWLAAEGQGRSLESVVGKTDFDIFSRPHAIAALEDEQRVIRTGEPMIEKIERETFHDRPDAWVSTTKLPLRDDRGRIVGTFGIARDVTAQMHDALTGLANRVALMDRRTQALVGLERQPAALAVLFSTSTISSASTTNSGTRSATGCWSRWASG
jgi:PAS domain S-box-containing protein